MKLTTDEVPKSHDRFVYKFFCRSIGSLKGRGWLRHIRIFQHFCEGRFRIGCLSTDEKNGFASWDLGWAGLVVIIWLTFAKHCSAAFCDCLTISRGFNAVHAFRLSMHGKDSSLVNLMKDCPQGLVYWRNAIPNSRLPAIVAGRTRTAPTCHVCSTISRENQYFLLHRTLPIVFG